MSRNDLQWWTNERVVRLIELFDQGKTGSQIAKDIGASSRCAVMGKLHRLGIKRDPKDRLQPSERRRLYNERRKAKRAGDRPAPPAGQRRRRWTPMLVPKEPLVTEMRRLSLQELKRGQCHYPIGDPKDADFFFCGADTDGTGPYCPQHYTIAHRPDVRRAA